MSENIKDSERTDDELNENGQDSAVDQTAESQPVDDQTVEESQTESSSKAETAENTEDIAPAPADSIQFSVVFDEDDDDDVQDDALAGETIASGNIYDALAAAEVTAATDAAGDEADSDGSNTESSPDAAGATGIASSASSDITASNAQHVNDTLKLATSSDSDNELAKHEESKPQPEPATTLASRIDRVLVGGSADDVLLKTYPTFALNKVTVAGAKGKVDVLSDVNIACYAGHAYAILLDNDPDTDVTADDKRRALLGIMTGLARPTSGTVMNKSANIADLEPVELRGHRLGIMPQRHAVRADLDAEQNVMYAMNASNRNFLKPKPVIARELLAKVGFNEATSGSKVSTLPQVQQRLVAIARAISTEAEVLILDEPTHGLDDDDTVTVFAALARLAHSGDPKHCVIVLTASRDIAEAADQVFEL
ncbi:ATP-binding cassette domain-containing protein [Bifidobacterium oedipodis]|uniref:ABC transporter ATP-binding protein n=1 Tax=Bifidobacterium oedipodis TaxID=2675322 RepID=A0A7Y0ENX7_9BIFI|nr:ATP-binding cassette domain-containing protein [Bifidobacterium sp. DSM 109957]NMM93343.1 ABC transporter ATP-binding protein [Bifidobacterium sp. DSM 109957]